MRCQVVNCRCYCRVSIGCEPMAKISTFQLAWSVVFKGNLHFHWARNGKNGIEFPNVREIHGASTLGMLSYWSNHCWWRPSTIQGVVHGASPPLTALGNDKFSAFLKHEILGCSRPTFPQIEISEHSSSFTRWGPLGPHSFQLYNPWRIHGAAIYGVPWIPSIYPIYVSIFLPAPWIRHGFFPSFSRWTFHQKHPTTDSLWRSQGTRTSSSTSSSASQHGSRSRSTQGRWIKFPDEVLAWLNGHVPPWWLVAPVVRER